MSQPPYGVPSNPDRRPLPAGWVSDYDPRTQRWFYVNTQVQPHVSVWEHPTANNPPPLPAYAPPAGPPPPLIPDRNQFNNQPSGYGYANPQSSYAGYNGRGAPYASAPPGGYGYGQQPPYGGQPPQPPQPAYGYQQSALPPPPPQPQPPQPLPGRDVIGGQRNQRPGMGVGTAVLAGGAGLVGGALLANAWEDHNEEEQMEGYDEGYGDAQDNFGGDW